MPRRIERVKAIAAQRRQQKTVFVPLPRWAWESMPESTRAEWALKFGAEFVAQQEAWMKANPLPPRPADMPPAVRQRIAEIDAALAAAKRNGAPPPPAPELP